MPLAPPVIRIVFFVVLIVFPPDFIKNEAEIMACFFMRILSALYILCLFRTNSQNRLYEAFLLLIYGFSPYKCSKICSFMQA